MEERNKNLSFGLENHQHLLNLELNLDGAYLFTETVDCFGGLPVGTGGRVALLLENGKSRKENQASLLAGLLMMKRGCSIYPLGFKEQNLSVLQKFSPASLTFKLVQDLGEIDSFAQEKGIFCLVIGDTFEDKKEYKTDLMVLKPLIAYTSAQVGEQLIQFQS